MIALADLMALWPIWVIFLGIAFLGGYVGIKGFQAYRSTRTAPMLLLGAGFVVLFVGMGASWFILYMVTENLLWCTAGSSLAVLAGTSLILSSVATRRS